MVLFHLLWRTSLLFSFVCVCVLSLRCSLCFCSAGRESCVCRNGMCLSRTRRERKSPETWFRLFLHASPRCAASWSGEISKLCTKGMRCGHLSAVYKHAFGLLIVLLMVVVFFQENRHHDILVPPLCACCGTALLTRRCVFQWLFCQGLRFLPFACHLLVCYESHKHLLTVTDSKTMKTEFII